MSAMTWVMSPRTAARISLIEDSGLPLPTAAGVSLLEDAGWLAQPATNDSAAAIAHSTTADLSARYMEAPPIVVPHKWKHTGFLQVGCAQQGHRAVSYTHLRAHET